jgi:hypothetical protein
MPEQSIILWDLETVPDLAAAARLLDMGGASDADVREALGSGRALTAACEAIVARYYGRSHT